MQTVFETDESICKMFVTRYDGVFTNSDYNGVGIKILVVGGMAGAVLRRRSGWKETFQQCVASSCACVTRRAHAAYAATCREMQSNVSRN